MLYLVATPIGNLADISLRALEVLQEADFIASEDTRKTGRLLRHFNIQKPQLSFHEHNEQKSGAKILRLLKQKRTVAVVTNTGTPGISDPGFTLVRNAIRDQIPVSMVPGPTALVMALVLSGLPVHSFTFRGFQPRKRGRRRRFLEVDLDSPHTLIFYESPYRIKALLDDAIEVYGNRHGALANDLTKMFEEVKRGQLGELRQYLETKPPRGEYTLVVEGLTRVSHVELADEFPEDWEDDEG